MEYGSGEAQGVVRKPSVVISVVVATYNEERHIGTCLQGLLEQQSIPGELEIIVVDGMSNDNTRTIVRSFADQGANVRVVDNPHRLQVFAWNIGWQAAQGRYVALMSAHAEYSPAYLASCLDVLQRTGASGVGGVQRPCGIGPLGIAVAWCMSSAFGVGNARFRYAESEEESDSVFGLFTERILLEELGGFDERVAFDEDAELNYRIRAAGGKLVVSPKIGVRYYVRESLHALGKQMYRYGYWRRYTQLLHPQHVPLRVYAPAVLLLGLAASLVLTATPLREFAAAVPFTYVVFLAAASLAACRRIGRAAAFIPASLATMHLTYGFGWLTGLVGFRSRPERKDAHRLSQRLAR